MHVYNARIPLRNAVAALIAWFRAYFGILIPEYIIPIEYQVCKCEKGLHEDGTANSKSRKRSSQASVFRGHNTNEKHSGSQSCGSSCVLLCLNHNYLSMLPVLYNGHATVMSFRFVDPFPPLSASPETMKFGLVVTAI